MRAGFFAAAAMGLALAWTTSAAAQQQTDAQIGPVAKVLKATPPLIDGHNHYPDQVRGRWAGKIGSFDMKSDLCRRAPDPGGDGAVMTDIPRLHAGMVGGQFWSVFIPVSITGPAAVLMTVEQEISTSSPRDWPRATRPTSVHGQPTPPTTSCACTRRGRSPP